MTVLVEYDVEREQLTALLTECDDQGYSTNVGAFGLKSIGKMTCDDFAHNKIPAMSFAGSVSKLKHPITDARLRVESFSPLNQ